MKKRHDYKALLKYMRMLKEGYSVRYIADNLGMDYKRLQYLWLLYQQHGTSALHSKPPTRTSGALKQQIVWDIQQNHLTLVQASLKYEVSIDQVKRCLRKAREQGIEALSETRERGRPPIMGRPRKKKPEEKSELELLRERVRHLEIENALLKKVKALVEEREARLRAIGRGQSEN